MGRAPGGGKRRGMTTRDLPYSFTRAQARALGATDRELAAAVRAVRDAGVLVVAETGNRGDGGPMEAHPSPVPGEDVAGGGVPWG